MLTAFSNSNSGIEKIFGGTGLGLTIAKKMVEALHGTLTLKSIYGQGSTFIIQFPLVWSDTVSSKSPAENLSIYNQIYQIICIDDDANLLALTAEVLRQKNHIVYPFPSAVEALKAIPNLEFDCIITDIQMPDLDGFGFIKELQQLDSFKNQPVLAVTGRADLDLNTYQNAGFASVVQKPYSPSKLLEQVHELFKENRLITFTSSENSITQAAYTLEKLKAFLPDDELAIREVLNAFVKNTHESLLILRQGINEKNTLAIQEIAHRMYPMFQQIEAVEIAALLNQLSTEELNLEQIERINSKLNEKTTALFDLFKRDSIL